MKNVAAVKAQENAAVAEAVKNAKKTKKAAVLAAAAAALPKPKRANSAAAKKNASKTGNNANAEKHLLGSNTGRSTNSGNANANA